MSCLQKFLHLLFVLLLYECNGFSREECEFNRSWRGTWYQSGLGEIVITSNHFTRKGICRQQRRDYFLVENHEHGCQQCLLIIMRHPNIIQYKESYCIGPDNMDNLCGKIRVEAVLYTLVREPSVHVTCPLGSAYHMIYNNNSGGYCRNSGSYSYRCSSPSSFHFLFRRCDHSNPVGHSFDRNMKLDCLATWKDGSDTFIYGQLNHNGITSKEEKYRCFIYSSQGTIVYLSMSADATCRGLRTSRDGPLTMELTEDTYGWPTSSCSFPPWLMSSAWRNMAGTRIYFSQKDLSQASNATRSTSSGTVGSNSVDLGNGQADNFEKMWGYRHTAAPDYHVEELYRCSDIRFGNETDINPTIGYINLLVRSHIMDGCEPKYQCLRIIKRHYNVVQLQKGVATFEPPSRSCSSLDFLNPVSDELLLIDNTEVPGSCPFMGVYRSPMDQTGCQLIVKSSCQTRNKLKIISSCHPKPVVQLDCLQWWGEGAGTLRLIARPSASEPKVSPAVPLVSSANPVYKLLTSSSSDRNAEHALFCYTIRQKRDTFEITRDSNGVCSGQDIRNISSDGSVNVTSREGFTFKNYIEECPLDEDDPLVLYNIKSLDDNHSSDSQVLSQPMAGAEMKQSDSDDILSYKNKSSFSSCYCFKFNLLTITLTWTIAALMCNNVVIWRSR